MINFGLRQVRQGWFDRCNCGLADVTGSPECELSFYWGPSSIEEKDICDAVFNDFYRLVNDRVDVVCMWSRYQMHDWQQALLNRDAGGA
jgi:hypothetical protein